MYTPLLNDIISNKQLDAYQSPSGRVTFNKAINKQSFAYFTPIITAIVPIDVVTNTTKTHILPSIARTLSTTKAVVYPKYLYLNATMDEYMNYEDEEDQDNMTRLLEYVDKKMKPVIGITVQKSEAMGSAHASAFIVWKIKNKYKFAFYDPLSYKRGNKQYDFIEKAFISDRFDENIEFINLNKFCLHKDDSDYHCVQYVMNAEYCYIYALFFLKVWIRLGAQTNLDFLKKTVEATYIVDPSKLTRVNTKESMYYRLIMIAFLCKYLLKYLEKIIGNRSKKYILDSEKYVKMLKDFVNDFKTRYNINLFKL